MSLLWHPFFLSSLSLHISFSWYFILLACHRLLLTSRPFESHSLHIPYFPSPLSPAVIFFLTSLSFLLKPASVHISSLHSFSFFLFPSLPLDNACPSARRHRSKFLGAAIRMRWATNELQNTMPVAHRRASKVTSHVKRETQESDARKKNTGKSPKTLTLHGRSQTIPKMTLFWGCSLSKPHLGQDFLQKVQFEDVKMQLSPETSFKDPTLPYCNSTLLYCSLLYSDLLYNPTLLFSPLPYCFSALLCSALLFPTVLFSTLLYSAVLCSSWISVTRKFLWDSYICLWKFWELRRRTHQN